MSSSSAVKDIADRLKRAEEKTSPGANVLTPKQTLLDARDVEKRHPEHRVRWVSLKNQDKLLARKVEGYEIISEADGGKRLGDDLVLARIPRAVYDQKIAAQERLHKERLKQHKTEMAGLAERLARELRDRHGIDIDVDRLLVNEDA